MQKASLILWKSSAFSMCPVESMPMVNCLLISLCLSLKYSQCIKLNFFNIFSYKYKYPYDILIYDFLTYNHAKEKHIK